MSELPPLEAGVAVSDPLTAGAGAGTPGALEAGTGGEPRVNTHAFFVDERGCFGAGGRELEAIGTHDYLP